MRAALARTVVSFSHLIASAGPESPRRENGPAFFFGKEGRPRRTPSSVPHSSPENQATQRKDNFKTAPPPHLGKAGRGVAVNPRRAESPAEPPAAAAAVPLPADGSKSTPPFPEPEGRGFAGSFSGFRVGRSAFSLTERNGRARPDVRGDGRARGRRLSPRSGPRAFRLPRGERAAFFSASPNPRRSGNRRKPRGTGRPPRRFSGSTPSLRPSPAPREIPAERRRGRPPGDPRPVPLRRPY